MRKLEKIIVIGGIVIGLSLVGLGLHRDNKIELGLYRDNKVSEEYLKNTIIKVSGLASFVCGAGLGLGRMLEKEEKRYRKNYKKEDFKNY